MNSLTLVIAALILAYSLTSAQNSCSEELGKCKPLVTGGETKETGCSKILTAGDCAKKLANSGTCTSGELVYVQNVIDVAYKEFKTAGCSGAGTLMTSLLLCLGLSGVAYFLTALK